MIFLKFGINFLLINRPTLTIRTPGKEKVPLFIHSLNLNPMVQVDISQLSGECNAWREKLRHYREEFNKDENKTPGK